MTRVFIGIGSNIGDRHAHMATAREALATLPQTRLVGFSSIHETEPVGPVKQGMYLNAAAVAETSLEPAALLAELAKIEQLAGRDSEDQRIKWGPRTLDLDILLYGDRVVEVGPPIVPHPRMHERAFVLRPLAELDETAVHPVLKMTVREMLDRVHDESDVAHQ